MIAVASLHALSLLRGLSESQLQSFLRAARMRRVEREAVILREGDQGDSLLILTRGSVTVTKRLGLTVAGPIDEAKAKVLVRLNAPQFFGEMGLLEGVERSATVTASEECTLLEISRSDFERLTAQDAILGYLIVRNIAIELSSRLRRTDRDVVKLTMALSLALGNR